MLGFLLFAVGLALGAQEILTLHPANWIGNMICADSLVFLGTSGEVIALSIPAGEVRGRLPFPGRVQALAGDGERFLAAGGWDTIRIWLWPEGALYWEISGLSTSLRALAFKEGLLLGGATDGFVYAWDVRGKALVWTLKAHSGPIWGLTISPSASIFATAGSDRVAIWDLSDLKEMQSFPGRAWDVAFSPDGFLLAAGMGKLVRTWAVTTWGLLWEAWAHESCTIFVAFSPDGTLIATGSLDRTVKLWDALHGQPRLSFPPFSEALAGVAFSPSRFLLAAAEDGTLAVMKP